MNTAINAAAPAAATDLRILTANADAPAVAPGVGRALASAVRFPAPGVSARHLFPLLAAMILTGCASLNPPRPGDSPEYLPTPPAAPLPGGQNNGAIFQAASASHLFEDYKARRVGDVLTVSLVERTSASKSAATSTAKESELEMNLGSMTLAGQPLFGAAAGASLFGASGTGSRSFDGSGDSSQSNQLSGEIAVTVAEVLPNGNLVVQGEKWLGINQGKEYVRLRGIVRPVDISARNSVLSTQIANVQVYYGGTGAIDDSNRQGWLSRFFNMGIWPF